MKKFDGKGFCLGAAALGILCLLACLPGPSARGVLAGLKSCDFQVIPALFPFFVVTGLILESPLADLHFDVQQIPLGDNSVDVVLCNHILEHVADDRKALRELHRILKPGGWGILLSPVDRDYEETFEDDSIVDPDERTRIFGQYDHRRIYGQDYVDRLRGAGFAAADIDYAASLPEEERRRYALPEDPIYVGYKH